MKSTNKLILAAAVVLSACQKEEALTPSNFPTDGVIRVATNVELPTTRGGMTAENIRTLSLNIENKADTTYSYFAFFDKSGSAWNCYADEQKTSPLTMLWQNSTQPVTVTALSMDGISMPKTKFTRTTMIIAKFQSDESTFKASDILYMEPTVINPATDLTVDGKLPVTFKHLLSKVNLSITLATELNAAPGTATNPIRNLKVNGTKLAFYWTPLENSELEKFYESDAIAPFAGAYTAGSGTTTKAVANYEVLLVPQTVAAKGFSLTFSINGKPYTWISNVTITLERGKQYALAITAGGNTAAANKMIASEWITGIEAKEIIF